MFLVPFRLFVKHRQKEQNPLIHNTHHDKHADTQNKDIKIHKNVQIDHHDSTIINKR